jgi:hypothetical protein
MGTSFQSMRLEQFGGGASNGGGVQHGGTGRGSEERCFFSFFWVLPLFLGGGWSGVATGYQHSFL